ncbi:hypothetical protein RHMOL_Rhmol04G0218300 [Rhododendron molle]|nr:hypothetical protein RHMOL_Rhmol04G0218300 [Rhododendron molle]
MTNLLVADPYFPYAFPYVYDYHLEHGAFPLPEAEEDGDEEAAPILVQLAPPNEVEFLVEGVEEEEEDPEEPEEDSTDEDGFHDPPQNEADWQHLMEMQHLDAIDNGWESNEEEIVGEPGWMIWTAPDVIDIEVDSDDVPPPPVEDDIGPYKAQIPIIF